MRVIFEPGCGQRVPRPALGATSRPRDDPAAPATREPALRGRVRGRHGRRARVRRRRRGQCLRDRGHRGASRSRRRSRDAACRRAGSQRTFARSTDGRSKRRSALSDMRFLPERRRIVDRACPSPTRCSPPPSRPEPWSTSARDWPVVTLARSEAATTSSSWIATRRATSGCWSTRARAVWERAVAQHHARAADDGRGETLAGLDVSTPSGNAYLARPGLGARLRQSEPAKPRGACARGPRRGPARADRAGRGHRHPPQLRRARDVVRSGALRPSQGGGRGSCRRAGARSRDRWGPRATSSRGSGRRRASARARTAPDG